MERRISRVVSMTAAGLAATAFTTTPALAAAGQQAAAGPQAHHLHELGEGLYR